MKDNPQSIKDLLNIDILKIGDCKFVEDFDIHFRKQVLSAMDPMKSPSAKRTLTLKAVFYPEDDRQNVAMRLSSSRNTVGNRSKKVHINIGHQDGKLHIAQNMSVEANEPERLDEESGYDDVTSWVQLANLGGGALVEQWYAALVEVAENIQDPNTPATDTRSITTKVSFSVSDDKSGRSMGTGKFEVIPTLCRPTPTPFNLTLSMLSDSIGVREHRFEQSNLFDT